MLSIETAKSYKNALIIYKNSFDAGKLDVKTKDKILKELFPYVINSLDAYIKKCDKP